MKFSRPRALYWSSSPCDQKLIPLVVFLLHRLSAQTLVTHTYGGSGSDAANAVTTDTRGNIYVAGTTTSFDLTAGHPAQSVNPGTSLSKHNAGFTWKPLANCPTHYTPYQVPKTMAIAVDPPIRDILLGFQRRDLQNYRRWAALLFHNRLLPAGYTDIQF